MASCQVYSEFRATHLRNKFNSCTAERLKNIRNNTKEQFANSPDLANGILNAVMDAFAAHTTMSNKPWTPKRCEVA